jgi:hypothetical protein
MTLRQKQSVFVVLIAELIQFAAAQGYELTFGEAYRSKEEAARLAKLGKGIKTSLHTSRLAVDFNLFRDGVYLTKTDDHRALGEFWETLSREGCDCVWGGRFGDGNHYAIAHGGRK